MTDLLDKKIENLSYEDAFNRLTKIIKLLEDGEISLDESIKYYEQGIELKNYCEKKLKNAEMKIKKVLNNNIEENT
ncbi:MAG: exodeoxyribonuclease VII small subunit [Pseudomonadota bacterium]|nr:exodeoxyribonuclease VII small subunit [Pseudomonadota bacterium]